MAVGAKIYNVMLLDRLKPHTDPKVKHIGIVSGKVGLQLSKYFT